MIRDERTTCSAPSEQSWRSVDTRNEQVPRTLGDPPHPGGSAASARAARKRRLALGGVASQRYRLTFKDNAPFLVSGLVSPASVRHGVLGSERAMARWKGVFAYVQKIYTCLRISSKAEALAPAKHQLSTDPHLDTTTYYK